MSLLKRVVFERSFWLLHRKLERGHEIRRRQKGWVEAAVPGGKVEAQVSVRRMGTGGRWELHFEGESLHFILALSPYLAAFTFFKILTRGYVYMFFIDFRERASM